MRAALTALVVLAACFAAPGCQRDRRPPPDMAEWELDETPRRSVATDDARSPARIKVEDQPNDSRLSDPSPLGSLIGRTCSVQFRRDALGMAAGAPLSPTAESSGGRPARLRGTLTAIGDGWITLSADGATYHIPQATILLIETGE